MAIELFDILRFEYTKATGIIDIPEEPTWTPVVAVTMTAAQPGVYMYGFAVQGYMGDTNDYAALRFRLNGGAWTAYIQEPGDNDDTFGYTYTFPKEVAATQDLTIEVEASKEQNAQQFDINFADVWIQRVK